MKQKKWFLNKTNAFTLIEILIVISILGTLALLSFFIGPNAIKRARDMKRKTDLELIRVANEEYYDAFGNYPTKLASCSASFMAGIEKLIPIMPCDPKISSGYRYVSDETENNQWYTLYTILEYTADPQIDAVGCRTGCGPECVYNYGIASPNTSVMTCTILMPTYIPTPTPKPLYYVCAPGAGQGYPCESFDDPERSQCPKVYPNDPTCNNECGNRDNRCRNASGKHKPE